MRVCVCFREKKTFIFLLSVDLFLQDDHHTSSSSYGGSNNLTHFQHNTAQYIRTDWVFYLHSPYSPSCSTGIYSVCVQTAGMSFNMAYSHLKYIKNCFYFSLIPSLVITHTPHKQILIRPLAHSFGRMIACLSISRSLSMHCIHTSSPHLYICDIQTPPD